MNRRSLLLIILGYPIISYSQVLLDASSEGRAYDKITEVLAPGQNPIETPDCSHPEFGDHIDMTLDPDLNIYVFRFHIHKIPDNDRCINFDRQRNEIKTYDESPENLLGVENEIFEYKWKFKIDAGFQASSSFTHLHQLKAVGGSEESMPLITLTPRKGTPDKLELRYAEHTTQVTIHEVNLEPFKGNWVEVEETVTYGENGEYSIRIRKVDDGSVLLDYSNNSIRMWKTDADFMRPKWGIYRSLYNIDDLRDEIVLFANFSIKESNPTDMVGPSIADNQIVLYPNPASDRVIIDNNLGTIENVTVLDLSGRVVLEEENIHSGDVLDLSGLAEGVYIASFKNGISSLNMKIFKK